MADIECARCGNDLGNGDNTRAVKIAGADQDGNPLLLYLGIECRCNSRVLTKAALRHHHEKYGDPEFRKKTE